MNNLFSKENIEGSELIHLPNLLMRVEINTPNTRTQTSGSQNVDKMCRSLYTLIL